LALVKGKEIVRGLLVPFHLLSDPPFQLLDPEIANKLQKGSGEKTKGKSWHNNPLHIP